MAAGRWRAGRIVISVLPMGHNLKGIGASYGFTEITEVGAEIERGAADSDAAALRKILDRPGIYPENVEIAAPATKPNS